MSIKKTSLLVMLAFVALAISTMIGCGRSDDAEQTSGADTATASLPAGLFLAAAPDSPVPVKQVKAQAKEGDEVVLNGHSLEEPQAEGLKPTEEGIPGGLKSPESGAKSKPAVPNPIKPSGTSKRRKSKSKTK